MATLTRSIGSVKKKPIIWNVFATQKPHIFTNGRAHTHFKNMMDNFWREIAQTLDEF